MPGRFAEPFMNDLNLSVSIIQANWQHLAMYLICTKRATLYAYNDFNDFN